MGIALFSNRDLGLMMLAAILVSNFPEGISSAGALKKEGFRRSQIFTIWAVVGLAAALATVLSFLFLHGLSANTIAILQALAAGAILTMLADSMMPEAYEEGGYKIGLLTILGFLVTFIMSRL